MSDCPVPAIARWSVSLLGTQSCQFVSSTQSWRLESPVPANARWSVSLLGAQSICKFYSIMTCLECPEPAIVRWSVSLLGTQSCQFVSSTQSWHVLRALCLRLQAGLCLCWVHSHVNLQVLLNHDISWVPCRLRLQAGLFLCGVQSHVNL